MVARGLKPTSRSSTAVLRSHLVRCGSSATFEIDLKYFTNLYSTCTPSLIAVGKFKRGTSSWAVEAISREQPTMHSKSPVARKHTQNLLAFWSAEGRYFKYDCYRVPLYRFLQGSHSSRVPRYLACFSVLAFF